jgi:hypothetical protein
MNSQNWLFELTGGDNRVRNELHNARRSLYQALISAQKRLWRVHRNQTSEPPAGLEEMIKHLQAARRELDAALSIDCLIWSVASLTFDPPAPPDANPGSGSEGELP